MKIPGKSLEALENFNDPWRNLKKFPQNPGKAAYSVTMYFKCYCLKTKFRMFIIHILCQKGVITYLVFLMCHHVSRITIGRENLGGRDSFLEKFGGS